MADGDEFVTINFFDSFTYNWFGTQLSEINLSRYGFVSMGREYIDFVYSADLDPTAGGSIKYLQKSSPSSLKISFEDVKWTGGNGFVQAQMELFENGDVLICYGTGDTAGNELTAVMISDIYDVTVIYELTL